MTVSRRLVVAVAVAIAAVVGFGGAAVARPFTSSSPSVSGEGNVDAYVSPNGTDFSPRWNYVAATYDGSVLRFYVDGNEVATTPVSGPIETSDGVLHIGGDSIWGEWLSGTLDELRIYNRALSPTEIQSDMTTPVSTAAGLNGIVAAYGFDEGSGTTATDASGNGNDGTISGPTWTAGRFGGGLAFDGNDDMVTVADSPSLELTNGMTLEAWVNPTTVEEWQAIAVKEASNHLEYGLWASTDTNAPEGHVYIGTEIEARAPAPLSLNTCTRSSPCRSFNAAYQVAQPGDVVEVAGGSYPIQKIFGTKAGKVILRPARGASVYVDELHVYADNLELRDFATSFWQSYASSDGLVMRNIDTGPFIIAGSSNVSVIGGDIGPSYGNGSPTNDSFITYDNGTAPSNVLIDGAYFHDFKLGYVGDHGQCLQVVGGNGITIRNSRFQRCDGYSIFFTQWAGPNPPRNILLENNFFDQSTNYGSYTTCCTYYSIQFASHMTDFTNITVRYNSALQPFSFEPGPSVSNVHVVANVAPNDGCLDGIVYAYNVWDGATCSPTDTAAPSSFVDPTTLDLHLAHGAAAVNHGDPNDYPATDIDGRKRPLGRAPDAGADEVG